MLNLLKREPNLFQGLIQAFIAMAISFGLGLTADQVGAITAFSAMFLAVITRMQVTPNSVVADKVATALNTPVPPKSEDSPMDQLKPEKE